MYLVVVVAVAGRKGVLSILGLAAALAVLVGVMIPALLAGTNPVVVVCVCALAMLILALYLATGSVCAPPPRCWGLWPGWW